MSHEPGLSELLILLKLIEWDVGLVAGRLSTQIHLDQELFACLNMLPFTPLVPSKFLTG